MYSHVVYPDEKKSLVLRVSSFARFHRRTTHETHGVASLVDMLGRSFFLAPAAIKGHSSDWATRVQRRVHEVGHGHVCDRVPRVAEPGVHRGLGGQPVLVETTRAASLLTVQRDGESVANESETDMGDLSHWQGRVGPQVPELPS